MEQVVLQRKLPYRSTELVHFRKRDMATKFFR